MPRMSDKETEKKRDETKDSTYDDNVETVIEALQLPRQGKRAVRVWPVFVDFAIGGIALMLILIVPEFFIEPPHRFFRCDDLSLSLPKESASETISAVVLGLLDLLLLVLPVMIGEFIRLVQRVGAGDGAVNFTGPDVLIFISRFFTFVGNGALGLLVNGAVCKATKYSIGSYRPTFLSVCKPNESLCSSAPLHYSPHSYSGIAPCSGGTTAQLKNLRLSFFSCRTSLTAHAAIFAILYIEDRFPRRLYGYSPRPLLQIGILLFALFVGYSRVVDHVNHRSDVFAGFLVGFATAALSAIHFAGLFQKRKLSTGGAASARVPRYEMGSLAAPNLEDRQTIKKGTRRRHTGKGKGKSPGKVKDADAVVKDWDNASDQESVKSEYRTSQLEETGNTADRPKVVSATVPPSKRTAAESTEQPKAVAASDDAKPTSSPTQPRKFKPYAVSAASEHTDEVDVDSLMKSAFVTE